MASGHTNNFTMASSSQAVNGSRLGTRKRVDSTGEGSFISESRGKRPRLSFRQSLELPSAEHLPVRETLIDQLAETLVNASSSGPYFPSPMRKQHLRAPSVTSVLSRDHSPAYSSMGGEFHEGMALMRSASMSSLASYTPRKEYPKSSAKHALVHSRITFDYSVPETDAPNAPSAALLTCSSSNIAYFTRGNRIHFKQLNSNVNTDISQFCKLSDTRGSIRVLACGVDDTLAVGTSKGYIQIFDVQTKKAKMSWPTTRDITALAWNGPILSVGGIRGSIRHYDTRLPAAKIKEQPKKVSRHEGQVTCLQWNENGKILASGDSSGTVLCWALGQKVPLEVGEFVSRRKKIQHTAKISALSWCPWESKMLATGDEKGILRLWNISDRDKGSNAMNSVDLGAHITGIHYSPLCTESSEILTTHGEVDGTRTHMERLRMPKDVPEKSLAVHSLPGLRPVTTYRLPEAGVIGHSVLDRTGKKLIFATPSTGKIDVCDIWAKKEFKHPKLLIR